MKLSNRKQPKRIALCPLKEVVFEVRFQPKQELPLEVVPVLIAAHFQDWGAIESLPLNQLPLHVRENDPNLRYGPVFRFRDQQCCAQVGTRSVSVVLTGTYLGWANFREKIGSLIERFHKANVATSGERCGLRFINFFESLNIFDRLDLSITLNSESLGSDQLVVRSESREADLTLVTQIANSGTHHLPTGKLLQGSVIDIDVVSPPLVLDEKMFSVIDRAHELEKKCFYGLISEDFIATLQPEYEEEA